MFFLKFYFYPKYNRQKIYFLYSFSSKKFIFHMYPSQNISQFLLQFPNIFLFIKENLITTITINEIISLGLQKKKPLFTGEIPLRPLSTLYCSNVGKQLVTKGIERDLIPTRQYTSRGRNWCARQERLFLSFYFILVVGGPVRVPVTNGPEKGRPPVEIIRLFRYLDAPCFTSFIFVVNIVVYRTRITAGQLYQAKFQALHCLIWSLRARTPLLL